MKRREFIAALGSAAAWPVMARAQSGKIVRIGVLWHAGSEEEEAVFLIPFRQALNTKIQLRTQGRGVMAPADNMSRVKGT